MIFVTVGTHEQQFNRIIKEIDDLKANNLIKEEVFIQIGYSTYVPRYCKYKKMITIEDMKEYTKNAKLVITHGGPGSIMLAFQFNKVPIVIPRNSLYNEHVDNHQIEFTKKLEREKKVLAIYDIKDLLNTIQNYETYKQNLNINYLSNTNKFTKNIEEICIDLVNK